MAWHLQKSFRGRKRVINIVLGHTRSTLATAPPHRVMWREILLCLSIVVCAGAGGWLRDSETAGRWAFLALLPLLVAIRNYAPYRATACGALWGIAHLVGTLTGTSDQHLSVGAIAALVVIPMLFAWLGAWSVRRAGFHPLVLAVGWMLVEMAVTSLGPRHGILLGVPSESGALSDYIARHFGSVLVCFAWALINSIVVSAAAGVVQAWGNIRSLRTGNRPAELLLVVAVEWYEKRFGESTQARAPPA